MDTDIQFLDASLAAVKLPKFNDEDFRAGEQKPTKKESKDKLNPLTEEEAKPEDNTPESRRHLKTHLTNEFNEMTLLQTVKKGLL